MNIVALIGIALISVVLSIMLKKTNPEYSIILSIITGIFLLGNILSFITNIFDQVKDLISSSGISTEHMMSLFKALGICFLTQFSVDTCNDAGQSALASKIEFIGKVMIIMISIPMMQEIIKMVNHLLGGNL